jgi:hypothetical protein
MRRRVSRHRVFLVSAAIVLLLMLVAVGLTLLREGAGIPRDLRDNVDLEPKVATVSQNNYDIRTNVPIPSTLMTAEDAAAFESKVPIDPSIGHTLYGLIKEADGTTASTAAGLVTAYDRDGRGSSTKISEGRYCLMGLHPGEWKIEGNFNGYFVPPENAAPASEHDNAPSYATACCGVKRSRAKFASVG